MFEEPHHPSMIERVEKRLDVGVEHPVHPSLVEPTPECIQRLMLTAPRPESIREAEKVRFIDRRQHRDHRLLDDLVLQRGNAQRPLCPIRLRNINPS
jgi:hypothetical protein